MKDKVIIIKARGDGHSTSIYDKLSNQSDGEYIVNACKWDDPLDAKVKVKPRDGNLHDVLKGTCLE